MKKLLTILSVLFTLNSFTQTTAIPDPNFEQSLIDLGYDIVLDGQVLTANIDTIKTLNVFNKNISNLTGIEDFLVLDTLFCHQNILTSINVTQNTSLRWLACSYNLLTSLDVTQNIALTYLNFQGNQLTNIDISQNTSLIYLWSDFNQLTNLNLTQNLSLAWLGSAFNQLTSLDVSSNTSLSYLYCSDNLLTCLNVQNGNNINFLPLITTNNPSLTCIEVDNVSWSTTNWIDTNFYRFDSQTSFSTSCNNFCSTVGINELNNSIFSIYPNPTSTSLTIESELTIDKIEILDVSGRIIKTIHQVSYSIDVSELPNGIYFLKLIGDDVAITKKFVKN